MNSNVKLSLILLLPLTAFCSENLGTVTTQELFDAESESQIVSASALNVSKKSRSHFTQEDEDEIVSSNPSNESSNPSTPKADALSVQAATALINTENNSILDLQLGVPYRRVHTTKQETAYIKGKDGIAKVLNWEKPKDFITRLLKNGKFADAATKTNSEDSLLPDYLRRTLKNHESELTQQSEADIKAILNLLKEQRKAHDLSYAIIYPLLEATIEYTPKLINLDSIEAFQNTLASIQEKNNALLMTFVNEIKEQKSFLEELWHKFDELKEAQTAQPAQQNANNK